jgi:hypothetical protein
MLLYAFESYSKNHLPQKAMLTSRALLVLALGCAAVLAADPGAADDAGAAPGEGATAASGAKVVGGGADDAALAAAPKTCPIKDDKVCSGNGACEQGYCKCVEGFTYMDCSIKVCKNGCNKRGSCKNGLCQCYAGYGGEDCSTVRCPLDCSGHGHCSRGDDGNGKGVCLCSAGYLGRACDKSNCPTVNGAACSGNGNCTGTFRVVSIQACRLSVRVLTPLSVPSPQPFLCLVTLYFIAAAPRLWCLTLLPR